MDQCESLGRRRPRWSVAALMGIVAIVAVLMKFYPWLLPGVFQAPRDTLDRLPERMQRLRPGLTERQVWWELGLAPYRVEEGPGNGSSRNYSRTYRLGSGYHLQLCFDHTSTPARFNEGSLSGPGVVGSPNLAPPPPPPRPTAARISP